MTDEVESGEEPKSVTETQEHYRQSAKAASVGGVLLDGEFFARAVSFAESYMTPKVSSLKTPDDVVAICEVGKDGLTVVDSCEFDSWRNNPRRRHGDAHMMDMRSFVAHTNRFKSEHSAIFANDDRNNPSLITVFDYHKNGNDGLPDFCDHRSVFSFPLSDEWKMWTRYDGQAMSQVEFARFLEDNIIDVLRPDQAAADADEKLQQFINVLGGAKKIADPSKLMTLATGLTVHEQSNVVNAHSLASGEHAVEFSSTHNTSDKVGVKLDVPSMFAIGIPVFKNGPLYRVMARLRYRKESALLKFWFDLWRSDIVFDDAFNNDVNRAQEETGLPLFIGSQENAAPES